MSETQPRIVITGLGQISSLQNTIEQLATARISAVRRTHTGTDPFEHLIASYGGEAWDFQGY